MLITDIKYINNPFIVKQHYLTNTVTVLLQSLIVDSYIRVFLMSVMY